MAQDPSSTTTERRLAAIMLATHTLGSRDNIPEQIERLRRAGLP